MNTYPCPITTCMGTQHIYVDILTPLQQEIRVVLSWRILVPMQGGCACCIHNIDKQPTYHATNPHPSMHLCNSHDNWNTNTQGQVHPDGKRLGTIARGGFYKHSKTTLPCTPVMPQCEEECSHLHPTNLSQALQPLWGGQLRQGHADGLRSIHCAGRGAGQHGFLPRGLSPHQQSSPTRAPTHSSLEAPKMHTHWYSHAIVSAHATTHKQSYTYMMTHAHTPTCMHTFVDIHIRTHM